MTGRRQIGSLALPRPSLQVSVLITGLLAFLLLTHGFIWYTSVRSRGGPDAYARLIDFTATLTGARLIRDGNAALLYDLEAQRAAQRQVLAPLVTLREGTVLPYIHPPFEALLVAPLLDLPYGALYLAWSLLIVLATLGSLLLLARSMPISAPARLLLLAALGSFSPLFQAFWLGQSSPLILLGLCGVYAADKAGRPLWGGVALALLVLKPQILLVVGALLLLRARWRILAVGAGIVAALGLAAMVPLGALWPLRYARFLAGIANWQGNHNEYPAIMYNWRGLATNLVEPLAAGLVAPAITFLTLLSLVGFLLAWYRSRGALDGRRWSRADELLWLLAIPVAVLIAPHLYIHDLVLLFLPAWILVAQVLDGEWTQGWARGWLALLWLGYVLAFSSLFRVEERPAFPTVPGVLLLATMAGLLIWRAHRHRAAAAAPAHPWLAPLPEARHG